MYLNFGFDDANISAFGLPPPPTHVSYLWPLVWGWYVVQYVVSDANIWRCQYICVQPSPPAPTHASYLWLSAWIQYVVSDANIWQCKYICVQPSPPSPPLTCLSYLWLLAWVQYVVDNTNISVSSPPPPAPMTLAMHQQDQYLSYLVSSIYPVPDVSGSGDIITPPICTAHDIQPDMANVVP
ncbi:hypothetical protein EDC04DRAFT_2597788 [Pisolithus marmoratus]|nr:hypothetical protein EDC04DRAFT_2597788 [Pisolithus marmoratus]